MQQDCETHVSRVVVHDIGDERIVLSAGRGGEKELATFAEHKATDLTVGEASQSGEDQEFVKDTRKGIAAAAAAGVAGV